MGKNVGEQVLLSCDTSHKNLTDFLKIQTNLHLRLGHFESLICSFSFWPKDL